MIKLEMKNYSILLNEKMQKYQPYHQAKLISMNFLQVKFTNSTLGKAIQNQGQIKTIESSNVLTISHIKFLMSFRMKK